MMTNSVLISNIEFTSSPSDYASEADASDPSSASVKEEETELILCLNSFVSFKNFMKNIRKRPKKVVNLVLSNEKLLNNITTNFVLSGVNLEQLGYMADHQDPYREELNILGQVLNTNSMFKALFSTYNNASFNSNLNNNTNTNSNNLLKLLNAYKVRNVANKSPSNINNLNKAKLFNNNIVKSELEMTFKLEVESYFKTISYLCNYSLENSNVLLNNLVKNHLFSFLNNLFYKYIVVSKFVLHNNYQKNKNTNEENDYCTKLLALMLEGIISLHYISNLYDRNQLNLYYNTFKEQNLRRNLQYKYQYNDRLFLMQDLLLSLYVIVNNDLVDLNSNYILYNLLTTSNNNNMNDNNTNYNTYEVLDYVNSILLLNNNYRYNSVKLLIHNILFKSNSVNSNTNEHSLVKYLKRRKGDQEVGDWYINVYLVRNNLLGEVLFDKNMDNLLLPLYLLNNYILTLPGHAFSSFGLYGLSQLMNMNNRDNNGNYISNNDNNNSYYYDNPIYTKDNENEVYNYVLSVLFSKVDPRRFGFIFISEQDRENSTLLNLLLRYLVQYCKMVKRNNFDKSSLEELTMYNTLLLFNSLFKLNNDFYVLLFVQSSFLVSSDITSTTNSNMNNSDNNNTNLLMELYSTLYRQGNFRSMVLVLEFFYYYFAPETYLISVRTDSRMDLELENRVYMEVNKNRCTVLNTVLNDFNLSSSMLNDIGLFNRYTKFYVLLFKYLINLTKKNNIINNEKMNNLYGEQQNLLEQQNICNNFNNNYLEQQENDKGELLSKMNYCLYHYFKFLIYEFNNYVLNNTDVDLLAIFYNNVYSVLKLAVLFDKQKETDRNSSNYNEENNIREQQQNLLEQQNTCNNFNNNNAASSKINYNRNEKKNEMQLKLVTLFINNTNNFFSNLFNVLLCNTLVNNDECYVYNKFIKVTNPEHLFLLEQQELNTDDRNVVSAALNLLELVLKIIYGDKNLLHLFFHVFLYSYNSSLLSQSLNLGSNNNSDTTTTNNYTDNSRNYNNNSNNINSNINLNNLLYANPNNINNLKVCITNRNVGNKYLYYLNENENYLNLLESLKTLSNDYSKCVDVLLLLFNLHYSYNKMTVTNNVLSYLNHNNNNNSNNNIISNNTNYSNDCNYNNNYNQYNSKLLKMENTVIVRKEDLLEHLLAILNNLYLNKQDDNLNKSEKEVVNVYKLITNVILNNYYCYFCNVNNFNRDNAAISSYFNYHANDSLNYYMNQKNKNNFILFYNYFGYDTVVNNFIELSVVNFLNSSASNINLLEQQNTTKNFNNNYLEQQESDQNNSSNNFNNLYGEQQKLLEKQNLQQEKERKLNLKILHEVLKISDFKFLVNILNKFINNISSRIEQLELENQTGKNNLHQQNTNDELNKVAKKFGDASMQQELELYLKNLNNIVEKLLSHYYFLVYSNEQHKLQQKLLEMQKLLEQQNTSNNFNNNNAASSNHNYNLLKFKELMQKKQQLLLVVGENNNICEVVEKLLLCYFLLYIPTSISSNNFNNLYGEQQNLLEQQNICNNFNNNNAASSNNNYNYDNPCTSNLLLDNVKYSSNMYRLLKLLNEQNVYLELSDTTKFLLLTYLQLFLYNFNEKRRKSPDKVKDDNLLQNYLKNLYKLYNLLADNMNSNNNNFKNNTNSNINNFNYNHLLHSLVLLLLNTHNECNEVDPNKLLLMCNLFSNLNYTNDSNDYENYDKTELYNKISEELSNYYNNNETSDNSSNNMNNRDNTNSSNDNSSDCKDYSTYEVLDYDCDFVMRFKDESLINKFRKNMLDKRVKVFKCMYMLNTNYGKKGSCELFKENNKLDNVINVLRCYNGQYKLRYHKYLKYLFKLLELLLYSKDNNNYNQCNSKLLKMENTVALKLLNAFKWDDNRVYNTFDMLLVEDGVVKLNYKYELYLQFLKMFTNNENSNFNLEFKEDNRRKLDIYTEGLEHVVDVALNTFYYRVKGLFERFADNSNNDNMISSTNNNMNNNSSDNNLFLNTNSKFNNSLFNSGSEYLYNSKNNNWEFRMVEMRYYLDEVLVYVKMLNLSSNSCNNNKLKLLNHLKSLVFNLMAVVNNLNNSWYNYKINYNLVVYNIFNNYVNLVNKFNVDLNLLGFMNYVKLFALSSLSSSNQSRCQLRASGFDSNNMNNTDNSNNINNNYMDYNNNSNNKEYTEELESRVRNTLLEKLLVLYVYNSNKDKDNKSKNEIERKENNKEVVEIYKEMANYKLIDPRNGSLLHLLQLINT